MKVRDPADPSNRNTPQTLEFSRYKMDVYQKVLAVVFSSLKFRSWRGSTIRCPDNQVRVFHPGILISSLDGKEAAYFNTCRAALANFPCPKCLVNKCDLHKITSQFELRTTPAMQAVVTRASKQNTKTEKENILKDYGLHDVQVCQLNALTYGRNCLDTRSIFYGDFAFPILTLRTHMIPCTPTIWGNGDIIFGRFYWRNSKSSSKKDL